MNDLLTIIIGIVLLIRIVVGLWASCLSILSRRFEDE